jgi:hypothetical protein
MTMGASANTEPFNKQVSVNAASRKQRFMRSPTDQGFLAFLGVSIN